MFDQNLKTLIFTFAPSLEQCAGCSVSGSATAAAHGGGCKSRLLQLRLRYAWSMAKGVVLQ